MGVPVIATNWAGATEFLTDEVAYMIRVDQLGPTSPTNIWISGFNWALPSVPHLTQIMR
jgi:hypothetical protein